MCNPYTQLYVGDRVFVINYGRTCNGLVDRGNSRFFSLSTRRRAEHNLHPDAFDFGVRADIPEYLEVDELTSSLSVLFEPTEWGS